MKYFVECWNDERLLRAFGRDYHEIYHNEAMNKGEVMKKLENEKNKVGILDFDKGIRNKYFKSMQSVCKIGKEIEVFEDSSKKNRLIVFYPRLEEVIVSIAAQTDTIIKGFPPGNNAGSLHKIGQDKNLLNNLGNLYNTLIQKSLSFQTLAKYL
jgi:hypothetical protein